MEGSSDDAPVNLAPLETMATGAGIDCVLARPAEAPITALLVLSGNGRDAHRYAGQWQLTLAGLRILVIAPHFDHGRFPGWRGYNLAGMLDETDRITPEESWLFSTIQRVRAEMRDRFAIEHVDLYGHSAGAQVLHRMVLFHDAMDDVGTVIAANAGWYTLPAHDHAFPYGLVGAPLTVPLEKAVSRDLHLVVGARDTSPFHRTLRRDRHADAQGLTRLDRARSFYTTAKQAALAVGVPLKWKLTVLDNVGHSNRQVAKALRVENFSPGIFPE